MKKVKDKDIVDAMFSMVFYNCIYYDMMKLIHAMKNFHAEDHYFGFDDACQAVPEIKDFDNYQNLLGGMLSEMFGTCGTSPRVGGVEDIPACVKFLQKIIGRVVSECYNGNYDEFIADYNEDCKDEF